MPCAASNVCQTESAERCVRPLAPECSAEPRDAHFIFFWQLIRSIDVFQKDIEEEFGLRPPTATALLKSWSSGADPEEPVSYDARRKKIVVTEEALKYKDCVLQGLDELNQEAHRRNFRGGDAGLFFCDRQDAEKSGRISIYATISVTRRKCCD